MDALYELWSRTNTREDFHLLFDELSKFLALTKRTNEPMAVLGKGIDELWHAFISCTELYEQYCQLYLGEFVHHRPHTVKCPIPIASARHFVSVYQRFYGDVPDIWFEGAPPEVISYAKGGVASVPETYRWSGWPGRR